MSYDRVSVQIGTLDWRDIGRSRHVLKNSVQEFLNTFVSVCRTAAYRYSCTLAGSFTQNCFHLVYRRDIIIQITHHQLIIQLADFLYQLGVIQLSVVFHIFRDINDGDIIALIVVVDVSFHLEQIDNSLEFIFLTNWKLKADSIFTKSGLDLIYSVVEVSTKDVHLVDECHTRYVVGISLTPYVLRLRLYTTFCTEHADSAVQYTKGTLNLYGEVYVAWSIDDVDTMLKGTFLRLAVILQSPVTGCSCRCDGNTSLLLLLHPVHGCSTFMSITNLIVNTSIIQNTLGQCGLTSIDMSHNSDISGSLQWIFSFSQWIFLLIRVSKSGRAARLESVMSECLVCLCHFVHIFFSLHSCTSVVCCIHDLVCQSLFHGLLASFTGEHGEPAKC